MAECPFYDIIKMRDFMSQINSYDNIKMGDGIFWMPFEWRYSIGTWYMSECSSYDIVKERVDMSDCSLYDINKLRNGISLNVLLMILFKWDCLYVIMLFI